MKFSNARCHKINKNCKRLIGEYQELILAGKQIRAEIILKRVVKRYGKKALELVPLNVRAF